EVMVATETVRNAMEDKDKTKMLRDIIAAGTSQYGMQTFDQSLYFLLRQGMISEEEALLRATNVGEFKLKLEGIASTADMAKANMERGMNIAQGAGREAGGSLASSAAPVAPAKTSFAPNPQGQKMPEPVSFNPDIKITLGRP
ncbi:MAG TPA: hypothetical protein VL181_09625, partial [Holophagaceae bacterium]|nr:hypothetical protein [Holophagaceae bacterium]